jgi:hypothetical protein
MKQVGIAGLVAALVAGLVVWVTPAPTQTTVERVIEQVGAVSGPKLNSPFWEVNGVSSDYRRVGMQTGIGQNDVICSVRSPISATSTLVLGSGVRFTRSSTTATVIRISKAATATATTTALLTTGIGANATPTIVATTTTDAFVFGPGQYMNVSLTGGAGTFSPAGVCQAEFRSI